MTNYKYLLEPIVHVSKYTGWKEIYVIIFLPRGIQTERRIYKCIGTFGLVSHEVSFHVLLTIVRASGRHSQHVLVVTPVSQDAEICAPRNLNDHLVARLDCHPMRHPQDRLL